MLSDRILYSHDFSDGESGDITKRNLTLITTGASTSSILFRKVLVFWVDDPLRELATDLMCFILLN